MKNIIKPAGKKLEIVTNVFTKQNFDFYLTSIYKTTKKMTGNYFKSDDTPQPPSPHQHYHKISASYDSQHSQRHLKRISTETLQRLLNLCKNSLTKTEKLPHLHQIKKILIKYPDLSKLAHSNGLMPQISPMIDSHDSETHKLGCQLLALLGMTPRISYRGVRVLSIDGGGIKGIVCLRILQKIEELSGKQLSELFDYVCGVSAGSVVAVGIFGHGKSPEHILKLYRRLIKDIFSQNSLIGAGKLVFSSSFYDSTIFDRILQEQFGDGDLIDLTRTLHSPKLSILSAIQKGREMEQFSFRNYNPPFNRFSEFRGTVDMKVWQAIRASSSIPFLFEEMVIDGEVFQDGGLLYNNPTAVALSEARNLWPRDPLQCVVSLGTGRYFPGSLAKSTSGSLLLDKCGMVVKYVGDPEPMHAVFRQMLPSSVYYRLNPILSHSIRFEETSDEKISELIHDTDIYLRKNEIKLRKLIDRLLQPPSLLQRIYSFIYPKYR